MEGNMYGQSSVERRLSASRFLALAPSFVASLVVTELFFKFGSFSLELVGFGVLWGSLCAVQSVVTRWLKGRD
jgi:hypothetical protein